MKPFADLEIFAPELRKIKYYQTAMKQIRGIFIRRSLRAFGIRDVHRLTKEQLDEAIKKVRAKEPLYGMWPPMVEAIRKGIYSTEKLVVKEITIKVKEKVEVAPGEYEEKAVQHTETVVESELFKGEKLKGVVSEQVLEVYEFHPSIVVATQTGTGKTDIAALAGLKAVLEERGKVMYLVPLRALAREKEKSFRNMWGALKKRNGEALQISKDYLDVEGLMGRRPIEKFDWVIATNEKADSLIRRKHPFIENLAVLIVDEGDFIAEKGRGPTLEVLITRIKRRYPKVQIIFLSATIPMQSIRPLAFWLNLRPGVGIKIMNHMISNISRYFIRTLWRPVKLIHALYLDGTGYLVNCVKEGRESSTPIMKTFKMPQEYSNNILNITLHVIKEGGQVLIFRNTRPATVSTAKKIAKMISEQRLLTTNELEGLNKVQIRTKTAIEDTLERVLKMGVAFHHAGVPSRTLERVERVFREGAEYAPNTYAEKALKVIVATTTLARGINLPARVVLIGDMWRYSSEVDRMVPISVREYHQFTGRAGRFGKEKVGYGFSVVDNIQQGEERIQEYICALGEELFSQLIDEPTLRKHLLATIAMDKIVESYDLKGFLANTFLARTEIIDEEFWRTFRSTLRWLSEHDFITPLTKDRFEITNLGKRTSLFVLDPLSVDFLREGAKVMDFDMDSGEGVDELGFLQLISFVEDNGYTRSKRSQILKGWEPPKKVIDAYKRNPEVLIDVLKSKRKRKGIWYEIIWVPSMDELYRSGKYKFYINPDLVDEWREDAPVKYMYFLRSIFTALVLRDWINELPEAIITAKFVQVQPGDIFRKHDRIEKIASIFGQLDKLPEFAAGITDYCDIIYWRLRKGIKEELISLARIPDIGRVWARKLYDAGYIDRSTLAKKIRVPKEFAKIAKLIGKRLTQKLLDRFKKPEILRKFTYEDKRIKKGEPPEPIKKTLEEVTLVEEKRADYYNEVLGIIKQLWVENDKKAIEKSAVKAIASPRLGIDDADLESIYLQLNRDNLIWFPIGGRIQLIT